MLCLPINLNRYSGKIRFFRWASIGLLCFFPYQTIFSQTQETAKDPFSNPFLQSSPPPKTNPVKPSTSTHTEKLPETLSTTTKTVLPIYLGMVETPSQKVAFVQEKENKYVVAENEWFGEYRVLQIDPLELTVKKRNKTFQIPLQSL